MAYSRIEGDCRVSYRSIDPNEWIVKYHGVQVLIKRLNSGTYRVLCGFSSAYAGGSDLAIAIQRVAENENRWLR
jgi:hypothetical protein